MYFSITFSRVQCRTRGRLAAGTCCIAMLYQIITLGTELERGIRKPEQVGQLNYSKSYMVLGVGREWIGTRAQNLSSALMPTVTESRFQIGIQVGRAQHPSIFSPWRRVPVLSPSSFADSHLFTRGARGDRIELRGLNESERRGPWSKLRIRLHLVSSIYGNLKIRQPYGR